MAVDGGDGDGVAQTKVIELVDIGVFPTYAVHLVHRQHHGLVGPQEHTGYLLIGGGHAGLDVAHENDHIGVVDGDLRLTAHESQNLAVGTRLDTAGIHDVKGTARPLALGIDPVTGDAGGVLHNGKTLSTQLVEEHGLAHIGSAHDCNQRFHGITLVSCWNQPRTPGLYR